MKKNQYFGDQHFLASKQNMKVLKQMLFFAETNLVSFSHLTTRFKALANFIKLIITENKI